MHPNDDGLTPLRGNVHAITNEHERLHQLASGLEDLGQFVRAARVDEWTGPASDLALDGRIRIATTCLRAAAAHAWAANALADYRDMLATLQPVATSLIAEARTSPIPGIAELNRGSLDRFRDQLTAAGQAAAAGMNQAAIELRSLQAALPDLPVLPAFTVPPLARPALAPAPAMPATTAPVPAKSGRHALSPPRSIPSDAHLPNPFRLGDPAQARLVVELNNQLLLALRGVNLVSS
ncbi:hypothetical protein [Kutzneria chonburiensis]|uniref:Uncharacterized protein n=1 Tax=Kutzneria chonburiensis TaxID=1483604 RepID=A0ABV6N503_9PSEU|nr:hypothetical protein [Kutzneria chonburiensis]